MNTPIDTNKDRATPSVWPVYVAAAVVVAVGAYLILPWLTFGDCTCFGRTPPIKRFLTWLAQYELWMPSVVWGLLGFVAAYGLVGLRPWGWWCTVLFAVTCTAWGGLLLSDTIVVFVFAPETAGPTADYIIEITRWLVVGVMLAVVLLTRRRLFFPPKPEGEE